MRYLLALGAGETAAALAAEIRAALIGHAEAGPAVLLSHHLQPAAISAQPEAIIISRALDGDISLPDALIAVRKAVPAARIVILLGPLDETARQIAKAATRVAIFNLLPGAVRAADCAAALTHDASYADVQTMLETVPTNQTIPASDNTTIAVLGARPGVGCGTVTANLAFSLSEDGVEAFDLRDNPALPALLFASTPIGGGLRRPGLGGVGVTVPPPGSDVAPLVTATSVRWRLCACPPDPRDPRSAAILAIAGIHLLVVTPDPLVLSIAKGWIAQGLAPGIVLNRHVSGFVTGPPKIQAFLGYPCIAVLPENPALHWTSMHHRSIAAAIDKRWDLRHIAQQRKSR